MLKKKAKTKKYNRKNGINSDYIPEFEPGYESEEIIPKTLKAKSDSLGSELLSICMMKYGRKLAVGMSDGNLNLFSDGDWQYFSDRVRGHSEFLSCAVKYDEDCLITGCDDG